MILFLLNLMTFSFLILLFFSVTSCFCNQLSADLKEENVSVIRQEIQILNPEKTDLFKKKTWDIENYKTVNLPTVMGEIQNKAGFSKTDSVRGRGYLDLPIHIPEQGWSMPENLAQFKEILDKIIQYERLINPNFESDHYVYITVAQSLVEPNSSQRRLGWHGDSYRRKKEKNGIEVDHVYLAYDATPTLFTKATFDFQGIDTENLEEVLSHFNSLASEKEIVTYPEYTLLKLDPYVVHNACMNNSQQKIYRTFVRISISQKQYCNEKNSHNDLFNYKWKKTKRWDRQKGQTKII